MASDRNGTIYTGVSGNLRRRVEHHRAGQSEFTNRYNVHRLVWFEHHNSLYSARQREANIKHWVRRWKLELIEKVNPRWRDLSGDIPLD